MKTKDLIKLLQEEDPTGECHVRGWSGAISHVWGKPGYYDGPYSYLEEVEIDGKETKRMVFSSKGNKIDIHCYDLTDLCWDLDGDEEKVLERVRFEYTYLKSDREENIRKKISEECAEARNFSTCSMKEYLEKVKVDYMDKGMIFIQPLNTLPTNYNRQYAIFPGTVLGEPPNPTGCTEWDGAHHLCQGESRAIIDSGKFICKPTKEYYIWEYTGA